MITRVLRAPVRHGRAHARQLSFASTPPAFPLLPLSPFIPMSDPASSASSSSSVPFTRQRPIWYVCGPTVYAPPHIGHARCYVTLDFYRRVQHRQYLSSPSALAPLTVMNITDIDDKILARSLSEGVPVRALTLRHERSFARSLADLNVWPPDVVLRVSEHMDAIVSHVERLVESGAAYVLDGEGVYFDVGGLTGRGITKYGKLGMGHLVDKQGGGKLEGANEAVFQWSQQQPPPQLEDIDGEAPTRQPRRSPRDFALWKVDAVPLSSSFPSPWGPGRPGWHIECTALISHVERLLGVGSTVDGVRGAGLDGGRATVDHHGGGVDLKFPHHTNEIIQGEGYHLMSKNEEGGMGDGRIQPGGEWISNWVHPGHLYIKGRKMSKSLKNFITVQEMLDAARETIVEDERQKSTVVVKEGDTSSPSSLLDRSTRAVTDRDAADLFRLWTLGYSGRPTANANWSEDRLKEMQRLRRSVIKLLLDIKGCEDDGGGGGSRKWTADEVEIFKVGQTCRTKLDSILSSADGRALEPSFVIREIVALVETASLYVEKKRVQEGSISGRGDVLDTIGRMISEYLDVCGFSEGMTKPWERLYDSGKSSEAKEKLEATGGAAGALGDNELQLFEVLRNFRAQVRRLALTSLKEPGSSSDNAKRMLKLCDEVRGDDALKKIGIEIIDDKAVVAAVASQDKDKVAGVDLAETTAKTKAKAVVDASNISRKPGQKTEAARGAKKTGDSLPPLLPKDMFRKGKQYVGIYDTFDVTGLPLTLAEDGRKLTDDERSALKKLKESYVEKFYSTNVGSGSKLT